VLIGLVTAFLATASFGVASILQAIGARSEPTSERLDPLLLVRLLRHPSFLGAMALSLAGFGLHLVALRSLPLFVVQPIIAASIAVTAVVSGRMADEPLGARVRRLVATVCVGLALVTAAAVSGGATSTSTGQRALLLVVVGLIAAVGWPAVRLHGTHGSTVLGLLSGAGYAVVAVAGRSMPSLAPLDLVVDPAAYALVTGGGLAILLYSISLQRGSVVTATAAMVVGNTVVPMAIGLAVLGDEIRSGWAPAAVLGLVLAATAVVLLHDPRVSEPQRPSRSRS
jgi:drug/metabolite transporter (DMT)-like permease